MMTFPTRDNDSAGLRVFAGRLGGLVLAVSVSLCAVAHGQQGGFKKGAAKKKKAKTKAKSKTDEETSKHAEKIYKLPSMKINRPLMDIPEYEATEKKLRSQGWQYKTVLQKGEWDATAKKVIPKWVEWRLKSLTMKEFRQQVPVMKPNPMGGPPKRVLEWQVLKNDLSERRKELMREFNSSGFNAIRTPPKRRAFRTNICDEIVKQGVKLLDNNFYVRMQVVLIFGELDVLPRSGDDPPEMYKGVVKPLLEKVLLDKKQPDALRVPAVNALKRVALLGRDMSVTMRERIADTLIKEFARTKTHPWYQRRLLEALSAIDLPTHPSGKAMIMQTLVEAMADSERDVQVRFQAAFAIGRASKPSNLHVDLLIHEMVRFSNEMATKYNAEVTAKKTASHWATSYLYLYFAFHQYLKAEDILYARRINIPDRKPWLLARYDGNAKVKGGYTRIRSVAAHVIRQKKDVIPRPVPAASIKITTTWLATNRPANFSLQPGLLPSLRPRKSAAANKQPGKTAATKKTVDVAGP